MRSVYLLKSVINQNNLVSLTKSMFLLSVIAFGSGCKKEAENKDKEFGTGKISVECEKKCNISYGTPGDMKVFDIAATKAIYYFQYKTQYNLDINIIPTDANQKLTLNVFSREEKQIFNNSVIRKNNEAWNSKVLVP